MVSSLDFFFELYTEEIPSSYQAKAIHHVRKKLPMILADSKLSYQRCEVDGTHRRLFILISSLSENQDSWKEKKKGPPKKLCITSDGKHTPQLLGFAKKVGVQPKDVSFAKEDGEEYSFVMQSLGGAESLDCLGAKLPHLFLDIPFEKTMRWGNKKTLYARPILQYFCHYKGRFQRFNTSSFFWKEIPQKQTIVLSHITREKAIVSNIQSYFELCERHGIVLKAEERLKFIKKKLIDQAKQENLTVMLEPLLLQEVNFLVERPKILTGEFSKSFLNLPEIIITTEMQEHQKYFPLKNKQNKITNKFLIIANLHTDTKICLENIRRGNQKVLASRLSDGAFFFAEDRKKPLSDYTELLKNVTHQEKIGSMFDKQKRIEKLAKIFLEQSSLSIDANVDYKKTCGLLKADLTTRLVYEFDNLQGTIGSIYATLDNENPDICLAIKEHYLPRFQEDDYPKSPLGILLSLCDKFDNLICSFLLGREPSASQDPLGVRRQTIYFIEIIIKNEIQFPFLVVLNKSLDCYEESIHKQTLSPQELGEKIWNFVRARFTSIFEKVGFDKKMIQASLFTADDNICRLHLKMSALHALKENQGFINLISAFTRMNNILESYKHKNRVNFIQKPVDEHDDQNRPTVSNVATVSNQTTVLTSLAEDYQVNEKYFLQDEEKSLYEFAKNFRSTLKSHHSFKNYEEIFLTLSTSKPIVDSFFDNVMVMHKENRIKMNRLALLSFMIQPIKALFNLDLLK